MTFLSAVLASSDYVNSDRPAESTWIGQLFGTRGYVTAYLDDDCPLHTSASVAAMMARLDGQPRPTLRYR